MSIEVVFSFLHFSLVTSLISYQIVLIQHLIKIDLINQRENSRAP